MLRMLPGCLPLLIVVCQSVACLADFPTTATDILTAQFSRLIKEADTENMIVADVDVRIVGTQVKFNVQFIENVKRAAWLVRMNIPDEELQAYSAECSEQGYQLMIDRTIRVRGQDYHTAVWVRQPSTPKQLVLPNGPLPTSGPPDEQLRPLDDVMQSFLIRHNVAGATIAVARNGRMVYSRGFGYADITEKVRMQPDAVMRIASISKSITAVTILKLVESGRLNLDDAVMPILNRGQFPKLKRNADARWNQITVRHLLQHSGGWDRSMSSDPTFKGINITQRLKLRRAATHRDIIRYQLTQPLDFDPGKRHAYSNFGYSVLGRVIEIVSGTTYEQCVSDLILTPCHMDRTQLGRTEPELRGEHEVRYHMQSEESMIPFWVTTQQSKAGRFKFVKPLPAPYGQWDLRTMDSHAGWTASAPDLLRFIYQLDAHPNPLLSKETIAKMVAPPEFSAHSRRLVSWYGQGWNVRRTRRHSDALHSHSIWHDGALAGTSATVFRRPDGYSWAVLFNTDESNRGGRLSYLISREIHDAVDAVSSWPNGEPLWRDH